MTRDEWVAEIMAILNISEADMVAMCGDPDVPGTWAYAERQAVEAEARYLAYIFALPKAPGFGVSRR